MRVLGVVVLVSAVLTGCVAQHKGSPLAWYAARDAVSPRGDKVVVCHGFGCHRKTTVSFSARDLRTMRRLIGRHRTAAGERRGIRRMIAWAEKRVAPTVGSAGDVGGLDLHNAGKRGQMDCIDEAANTSSYLLVAEANGFLRHHRVASPVARGFLVDLRYPHATAVVADRAGTPWAVDSWPMANGVPPQVMPLEEWFEDSRRRFL